MDTIERLRIVCLAGPGRSAEALAVRRRLETVARGRLPAALDRQLGASPSIELDRVTVRLDVDPLALDDETLATLWAGRIRDGILAASRHEGAPARRDAPSWSVLDGRDVDREPIAPDGPLVPTARRVIAGDRIAALAIARAVERGPETVAAELAGGLAPGERRALVARLVAEASRLQSRRRDPSGDGPGRAGRPPRERAVAGATVVRAGRSWPAVLDRASRRLAAADRAAARAARPADGARGLRSGVVRSARPRPTAEPGLRTTVAGIALLWPWLASTLPAAVARLPDQRPADARRLALAALVQDEPAAVDDPLVLLLAGDDPTADPSVIVVTPGELAAAAEDVVATLDGFAEALPGFAGSSPDFLRREFLVRPGRLGRIGDEVTIDLAPLPLDPAAARLPYPIAAFRLPWTPPIRARLETR